MAHYTAETSNGTVEFDSPRADLSKDEVQQVVNQNHPQSKSYKVPSAFQKIAQGLTMPGRGMRGMGVGLEQMMLHPTQPASALNQASQATQPGFQPQPGQKLGAFAGGMADPINIGAGAVLPGGSFLKSLAGGAGMAGGASVLDQASTGKVNPSQAGLDALMGGATGGALHGIVKGTSGLVKNAPQIFQALAKIPDRATEIFRANKDLPQKFGGSESEVELNASKVQKSLTDYYDNARAYFKGATTKLKANLTPEEKSKAIPIPATKIADTMNGLVPVIDSIKKSPDKFTDDVKGQVFKTLLHIRQSIDHHVSYSGAAVPEISSVQEGGLKELRQGVNKLIEQMPGGEILRDADKTVAAASQLYDKLQPKMKNVGDAVNFLKKTFEMDDAHSREDMLNLLALEKVSGKPVVNDMFKALTMSHFSTNLAGNKLSRSIAGASPFLISAMLRITGMPFQASLPLSAVMATASQSPKALGGLLRGAQSAAPVLEKAAKPSAIAALNAIRQRNTDQ